MTDLSPQKRKEIAAKIKADIDQYCIKTFTGEHREHLGASLIGHECNRFVWYAFRWVKFQVFDGRMLRILNRGHLEEKRIVEWLRGIGCQVWEVDPQTNKQFRVYGVENHYGGSADGAGILPDLPNEPVLLEFKTHNTKSFINLSNKASVVLAKPIHYSQMCSYGKFYKFKYGLYVAINKNDDDLYIELVELDWNLSHDLINKAADIINTQIPPIKIAENPAHFSCKWCNYKDICWNNEPVEINCRSCKYAKPIENANWYCNKWDNVIPLDFIKNGCPEHKSINN